MNFRLGVLVLATMLVAGCGGRGQDSGLAGLPGLAEPGRAQDAPLSAVQAARAAGKSIASAADHGALISYPDGMPSKQEGGFTWYPVSISEEHAFNAIATGEMTIPAPDGTQLKLRYERYEEQLDGNWTWVGRVVGGDPNREAVITFGEQAVFGSIPQQDGLPLKLSTRQGVLWAVRMDTSKGAVARPAASDAKLPPRAAASSVAVGADANASAEEQVVQSVKQTALATANRAAQTTANTIDIAIGYTSGFVSGSGGSASSATTRLANLIATGNQALSNSNVNGYFRLVKTVQVGYTDGGSNETALDALTGNGVAVPSSLATLRSAREESGADVAILMRKFSNSQHGGCGVAWLLGGGQEPIVASDANYAYGVVSDGRDQGYECDDSALAHEVGHLLGSAHDRAHAETTGRYPYSFGYLTGTSAGNFYTVMAYGDPNSQTSYLVFSNPNITICGGRACGVANSEDNARSLNQTIPVVAQFRAGSTVPGAAPAAILSESGDFNGDGVADILWHNTSTYASVIWLSGNSSTQQSVATANTPANWKIAGVGDFDGDGKTDILWRHSVNGGNSIWRSGNVSTPMAVAGVTDLAWQVAGIGDFNGDGRSDILWHHSVNHSNAIWLSANVATQQSVVTANTPAMWKVAGIGDFDGDGKSDILWRHSTNGANSVWRSGNAGSPIAIASVANLSWKVAGIGDFNGDGKSDILWHHSIDHSNSIWRSANVANQQAVATANTPALWGIARVGDFNGDGRSDILWRHSTNGGNSIWRSASVATPQAVSTMADLAWYAY